MNILENLTSMLPLLKLPSGNDFPLIVLAVFHQQLYLWMNAEFQSHQTVLKSVL